MNKPNLQLGPLATQFFALTQARKMESIQTGDLVRALGFTPQQEADLFKNMSQSGLIVKLMRGIYLVPDRIPLNENWKPSSYFMLNVLMRALNAKYQVTGWAAFTTYGLSRHTSKEISVYNTVLCGLRQMGGSSFCFIKVADDRLGADQEAGSGEPYVGATMGSLPRVVFDAVYDHSRFNTLPIAYEWIAKQKDNQQFLRRLVDITLEFGNVSTKRRIGCWLDYIGIDGRMINPIKKSLPETKSLIPLIPEKNPSGRIGNRWGILLNVGE